MCVRYTVMFETMQMRKKLSVIIVWCPGESAYHC